MSSNKAEALYRLLPAVYRIRDAAAGGPLRELVEVLAEQVDVLGESLDQAYDDLFIETCAEWLTPYLGELVGYRVLGGADPAVAAPRAEVANTIRFRRRKGTAAMLEQLARDVTDWPAVVVEYFSRLATSQYAKHIRPGAGGTADLRSAARLAFVDTAFDDFAHTAEVRRISTGAGRYNIPNIGIILWRTAALPLVQSPLVSADGSGKRFRFDPLGTDAQLFGRPRTEEEITHLAEPFDVPLPLTRRFTSDHVRDYYGPNASIWVEVSGGSAPSAVSICDLRDVTGGWAHEPATGSGRLAIDPVLGRACFADPLPGDAVPLGSVHYGCAVPVGGGGYDRGLPPGDPDAPAEVPISVKRGGDLQAALDQAAAAERGGTVEVADFWRYPQTPAIAARDGTQVTLRAADRVRPHLAASGAVRLRLEPGARVVLDGLLVSGGPVVIADTPGDRPKTVLLRHTTLVPGLTRTPAGQPVQPGVASLLVLDPFAEVTVERCVLGPIVAVEGATVRVVDSVLDASTTSSIVYCGRTGGGESPAVGDGLVPGAALDLQSSTVVGRVHAERIDISDTLVLAEPPAPADTWRAPLWVRRRQVGCARFSLLPAGSRLPAPYRCQTLSPDLAPHFEALRFGDPRYAQLRPTTPSPIREGASDGGEMGVTHFLDQPQREANLRVRLTEYLRFGLEAGIRYADPT